MDTDYSEAEFAFIRARAAVNVERRFAERQRLAETEPRGTLLNEGSAGTILECMRCYTAPIFIPGRIHFHFARESDEDARWSVVDGVMLYKCGALFIAQSLEDSTNRLKLSFDGRVAKRLREKISPRQVEPRYTNLRGIRLA